jgi:hypothetical protein
LKEEIAYPVMARENEMICTKASIPKGIFISNDVDVVYNSIPNGINLMGSWHV